MYNAMPSARLKQPQLCIRLACKSVHKKVPSQLFQHNFSKILIDQQQAEPVANSTAYVVVYEHLHVHLSYIKLARLYAAMHARFESGELPAASYLTLHEPT